jgi:hypothetical protein
MTTQLTYDNLLTLASICTELKHKKIIGIFLYVYDNGNIALWYYVPDLDATRITNFTVDMLDEYTLKPTAFIKEVIKLD